MKPDVKNLPIYTRKEELINSITHLVGFVFSLWILIFFIIFSSTKNLEFKFMIPYFVYALSMMVVFAVSTIYHSSKQGTKGRAILRVIDHTDIYFLVFGTYFPLCMYAIGNQTFAMIVLILEIIFMISGMVLNLIPYDSLILEVIAYIIYIIDGWLIIFFYPFGIGMDFNVFLFILIGGIIYSLGAITYAVGKKRKYFHSLFHVFVVLGAITQFFGIAILLIK